MLTSFPSPTHALQFDAAPIYSTYRKYRLLGLSTLGPDFMRTHRIRKRLSFLLLDDILLIKEVNKGMKVEKMKDRELAEALQTRGIPNPETLSRSQRNSLLNGWLGQAAVTSDADDLSRRLALVLTHA
ncbi:hypothetical protein D9619_001424 [Psilocybe cf. subviscida]|uniref:Letm1 RBD domain-containing protein n=1 Tax=Psilocybe cf. subviscida TaxID=2480587 RepID=A0A8H5F3X3_9AGAR|nr:hypothetical protein D9619_001424 [Psilocybe cf. subviscida]